MCSSHWCMDRSRSWIRGDSRHLAGDFNPVEKRQGTLFPRLSVLLAFTSNKNKGYRGGGLVVWGAHETLVGIQGLVIWGGWWETLGQYSGGWWCGGLVGDIWGESRGGRPVV